MPAVTTVGLDIAKSVFQVHGVDAAGQVVIRRQLKRRYVLAFFKKLPAVPGGHRSLRHIASLVARAQGARPHRSADAAGLREAYVKRQKNDAADAEAICKAGGKQDPRSLLVGKGCGSGDTRTSSPVALANKNARIAWSLLASDSGL